MTDAEYERGAGERPIGFWLKRVDQLIDDRFATMLAAESLSRRDWQVLNVVCDGIHDRPGVATAIAPFVDDDPTACDRSLAALCDRGWIDDHGDVIAPTDDGISERDRVASAVTAMRRAMSDGITREDYATTIRTLQRMAANLET